LTIPFLLASVIYAASNEIINMDLKLETISKETVLIYFKAISQSFTGQAEEKCEKLVDKFSRRV
jgi:hypothetical protein